MIRPSLFVTFLLLTCFTILGCDENERVAQVAIDAAEQQAKQNDRMAQNNRKLLDMQHDLQAEQSQVGNLRDELEDERRNIASQRLTESRLSSLSQFPTECFFRLLRGCHPFYDPTCPSIQNLLNHLDYRRI